jgi:DNA-binding transcriptional LysR family regulator
MIPSPSDISYFVEAAATGNLSRAAERLGISQPSLSLAIVRIENALGAKVFHRSRRGVELTRSGKQLLVQSQKLYSAWEEIQRNAIAATDQIQGNVTIGVHPSVALYSLGKFLPEILSRHPQLRISLKHDLSRKVTDAVLVMEADIAIAVNPVRHPDLILSNIATDDVTLWRKASKGKNAKSKRFDDAIKCHEVLIFDPALTQTQHILRKLSGRDLQISRVIESNNLEVICELTASGCGVGILPTRVAERASQPLVQVADAPVYRDEICLVIRAENRRVAPIACVAEAIKRAFQ